MRKIVLFIIMFFLFSASFWLYADLDGKWFSKHAIAKTLDNSTKESNLFFSPPPFVFEETSGVLPIYQETFTSKSAVRVYYPQTQSDSINDSISFVVNKEIEKFKKENQQGSLDITFSSKRYNDYIMGFVFNIYAYNPITGLHFQQKTINYDFMGACPLHISDLFAPGYDYAKTISTQTRKQLLEMPYLYSNESSALEKLALHRIEQATSPNVGNFTAFAFDSENLYVYFSIEGISDGASIQTAIPIRLFGENWYIDTYFLQYFGMRENDMVITEELDPYIHFPEPKKSDKKYIAFTFDDGPHPVNTPKLLEGLDKLDAKVTFFLLGHRLEPMEQLVKTIDEKGHAIGNHSYSHKQFTAISSKAMVDQIDSTNRLLTQILNKEVTLLRPPYGDRNKSTIALAKERDLSIILWNIDPQDWKNTDAKAMSKHIVSRAKDGSIVLLHDIYGSSVDAALLAMEELKKQGYEFVTVPTLIERYSELKPGGVYHYGQEKVLP